MENGIPKEGPLLSLEERYAQARAPAVNLLALSKRLNLKDEDLSSPQLQPLLESIQNEKKRGVSEEDVGEAIKASFLVTAGVAKQLSDPFVRKNIPRDMQAELTRAMEEAYGFLLGEKLRTPNQTNSLLEKAVQLRLSGKGKKRVPFQAEISSLVGYGIQTIESAIEFLKRQASSAALEQATEVVEGVGF